MVAMRLFHQIGLTEGMETGEDFPHIKLVNHLINMVTAEEAVTHNMKRLSIEVTIMDLLKEVEVNQGLIWDLLKMI